MAHIPIEGMQGRHNSLWTVTSVETDFPPLEGEQSFDVAIIGGGLTGITCAYMLNKAGLTTCVIEKDRLAHGTTGHSTAKITSNHGIIYSFLEKQFGKEKAAIYGEANQWAINWMLELAEREHIACDMAKIDAYTYAGSDSQLKELEKETGAARSAGLPAEFVSEVPLPFKTSGGMVFRGQARFHPRKYLLGMLPDIQKGASRIYERTMAVAVTDGDPCEIKTDHGTVKARNAIVATMYPFPKEGEFFARLFPKQSYVIAARVSGKVPEGMFFSADEYGTTIRRQEYDGGDILVFGGDVHKVGQGGDIIDRFKALEGKLRSTFDVRSLEYYWDTQDAVSMDLVPYIGKLTAESRNVYVATGFKQWGLAHGTVAGSIITDMILGRKNEWLSLYDSTRMKPKTAAKAFLGENLNAASEFINGFIPRIPKNLDALERDQATRDSHTGVYRDHQGKLHCISQTCTHLGCDVIWNNADRTWDCPCHGSRFSFDGDVLYGPASQNLPLKECSPERK